MLINRTGTFRGKAVEAGVSLTGSGLPQYTLKCLATEYFDANSGEWVDWIDVDENTITGYLCLFGKDNTPIFHAKDIQTTFGWDGTTLSGLDALDVSGTEFQFTVEEHLYNEKTSLQVSKIAPYDAVPGATLRRVNASELKTLDAKFGAALLKQSGGKKAATAPAKPSTMPAAPKKTRGRPAAAATETPAVAEATPKLPPTRGCAGDKHAPKLIEYATAEAAWEAVNNVRAKDVTDEALATAWGEACATIAGDAEDADITPVQWGQIVELVNKDCAIF